MNKQRRTSISDFTTEVKLKGFKVYEVDGKNGKAIAITEKISIRSA